VSFALVGRPLASLGVIRSARAFPGVVVLTLLASLVGPGLGSAAAEPIVGPVGIAGPPPGVVRTAAALPVAALGTSVASPTWVVHTRTPADADRVLRDVGALPTATYGAVAGFAAPLTPA
jgi:hypothetical protein